MSKLIGRVCAALSGRRSWMRLKREFDVDRGMYVVLMPEDDGELNEAALRHLDDMARYRKARGIVVLTDQPWVMENARTYSETVIEARLWSKAAIDRLLSFYELYGFSERLIVVSLIRPYGSNLYRAVGANGVTKEELVCVAVFLIRNWRDEEAPRG